MVKKAALLAAILVLQAGMLAGCTSNEQAAQSAQSQTETQAQQTQNLSVQSTAEQTAAQQQEIQPQGSVQFADAGELSQEQQDLLCDYIDRYYQILGSFEQQDLSDLFASDAQNGLLAEQLVLEYGIQVRSSQRSDLHLTGYSSTLQVQSVQQEEDGNLRVMLREDVTQNFAQHPEVDSNVLDSFHMFELTQEDGSWKVVSHTGGQDRLYWTLSRSLRNGEGDVSDQMEQQAQELIELLQVNVARREQTSDEPLPQAANAYDRQAAVAYAKQWVTDRNDEWPDYSMSGGNCQNFVSQCLLAGGIPMDSGGDAVWKWYGDTPNNLPQMAGRSASWSGVDEFLQYAASNTGSGMVAVADADYYSGEIGDVLILGYDEENLYHAVIITDVVTDEEGNVVDYLVHSNTANQESFPASAYGYTYQVLVKICGWN